MLDMRESLVFLMYVFHFMKLFPLLSALFSRKSFAEACKMNLNKLFMIALSRYLRVLSYKSYILSRYLRDILEGHVLENS